MHVHIVVMERSDDLRVLCYTENDEPAVYNDSPAAEIRAAQLREHFPENIYHVLSPEVLP